MRKGKGKVKTAKDEEMNCQGGNGVPRPCTRGMCIRVSDLRLADSHFALEASIRLEHFARRLE